MKLSEKNIISIGITSVLGLAIILGAYWTLNKEQINLKVKGSEVQVATFKTTVEELLEEQGIKYDEDDIITPKLDTEVVDYMDIEVIDVTKEEKIEVENIPFESKTVEDGSLVKGKTIVEQDGEDGEKELTYELTYHNGKLANKELVNEEVSLEPVEEIVKKGTKEEITLASIQATSKVSSYSGSSSSGGTHMVVEASAYAGHTITATGTVPKWGTIAVDPRVIPYGTKVYIPQFDMTFVAEDCGGAIKGNKIDIFMNSTSQAYTWGRRNIDVYVMY